MGQTFSDELVESGRPMRSLFDELERGAEPERRQTQVDRQAGGRLIGLDEAGLGPNLGPLVVVATVWQTTCPPRTVDFWSALERVIDRTGEDAKRKGATSSVEPARLHVADSKQVFQPHKGMGPLARSVLTLLGTLGPVPLNWGELLHAVRAPESVSCQPELSSDWTFRETADLTMLGRWQQESAEWPLRLKSIFARVVGPAEFNDLIDRYGNKSTVVSSIHQSVLAMALAGDWDTPALVVSDQHGGRHAYGGFLEGLLPPQRLDDLGRYEGVARYECGGCEFEFRPRAEESGPVACASIVAKLVREYAMHQVNAFWQQQVPDLRPTQGYPVDAKRFWAATATARAALGLSERLFWRCR